MNIVLTHHWPVPPLRHSSSAFSVTTRPTLTARKAMESHDRTRGNRIALVHALAPLSRPQLAEASHGARNGHGRSPAAAYSELSSLMVLKSNALKRMPSPE